MTVALLTCAKLVRYWSSKVSAGRGTRHKWLCPNLRACVGAVVGGAEKLWLVLCIGTYWCGTVLVIF